MKAKIDDKMGITRSIRFQGAEERQLLQLVKEESELREISENAMIVLCIKKYFAPKTNPPTTSGGQVEEVAVCDMPDCVGEGVVGRGFWLLNNAGLRNLCLKHYFEARDLQERRHGMAWKNLEWTYKGKRKLCHYATGNRFYRGCEVWAVGKAKNLVSGEVVDVCSKCLDARRGCLDKWQILKEAEEVYS